MKYFVFLALACPLFVVALSSVPARAFTLYDDFNSSPQLNATKWVDLEFGTLDVVRRVQAQQLHLLMRGYAETTSNSGTSLPRLGLTTVSSVTTTAMEATVQIKNVKAKGCPGNFLTPPTVAGAGLVGRFFNSGTPAAGDQTNDVLALIFIGRASNSSDPANVLQILGVVFQCTNADCSVVSPLGNATVGSIDNTTTPTTTLRIEWDAANNWFLFGASGEADKSVSYTVADEGTPGGPTGIGPSVAALVPNCTTQPRPQGFVNAFFDDVDVQ
ncbi:MAG: hypothetical protein HY268_04420 [Deltaproteobacteria bacterium]|nr:hypothetical protein [Deltaproteobacteria bacterium]